MIVVDTSAVLAALLGHDGARSALASRRLCAPHLIDVEVAHALRGLVFGRKLSPAEGQQLLGAWRDVVIDRLPVQALLPRVWELRDNLTAYDAAFVASAEALEVPLVTADRRLATSPGIRCRIELVPS